MRIMTVRAPDDLQDWLLDYAEGQGYSRNELVLMILHDFAENKKGCQRATERSENND